MQPEDQESGAIWKLVCHYIDEMSWRMLVAGGLIAFFFFYGATNALIKLTGREISSFNFPPGPVFGLLCASFVVIVVVIIKLRPRQ